MDSVDEKLPISVIVPVKNEAANMRRCLENLQWADEIFVVDSQSEDDTAKISEEMGAQVVQFHFNGVYPKKKNWSLENLPMRNEWVLIVDADEVIPQALHAEIAEAIKSTDVDGYHMHFRYMFLEKPLYHCGYSGLWVLRLFRHKLGRYEKMPVTPESRTGDNEAHEHIILEGRSERLNTSVMHYAYPSIDAWVEKHNRYSNWEAVLYEQFRSDGFAEGERKLDRSKRMKRKIKALYLRLPFRYVARFIYAYIFRLGFLDGKTGFIFCSLLAFYDFLSWAKVIEKRKVLEAKRKSAQPSGDKATGPSADAQSVAAKPPPAGPPKVSVLILSLNEEVNLSACIESVSWCDDVVVFDSFSSDKTEQIATTAGARFFQREFDDYASQRNAALEEVQYKHPWVFMLDADERFTPELTDEIATILPETNDQVSLIRLRRKDMFMDRWIKHSSGYPTWFGRLMRVGKIKFERKVHEHCYADGEEGFLQSHMVHYPFSKGVNYWLERHNIYSTMEAEIRMQRKQEKLRWGDLFSSDPAKRRKAGKKVAYSMPLRPSLVFMYLYICRLGILDGVVGLRYCMLRFIYEIMINTKIKELKHRIKSGQ